jgi:hypothetical protein
MAHTTGWYYGEIVFIAPAFIFLAFYFMFFPKDFIDQYSGKLSPRMWAAIAIALLLGLAHMYIFEHGLY